MNSVRKRPYEFFEDESIIFGKYHLTDETVQEQDGQKSDNTDTEDILIF